MKYLVRVEHFIEAESPEHAAALVRVDPTPIHMTVVHVYPSGQRRRVQVDEDKVDDLFNEYLTPTEYGGQYSA